MSPETVDTELVDLTRAFVNLMSGRKVSCIVLLVPIASPAVPLAASNMFTGCKEKADALRAWVEFLEDTDASGRTSFIENPKVN